MFQGVEEDNRTRPILSKPDNKRLSCASAPMGATLSSAHAIDRKFKVLQALQATPVPVPRPLPFHTDSDIVGTPFYLMERLQGRVFHDSSLPGVAPAERRQMYLSMADALAALQALDPKSVGLADFGRSGDYFARQLARWSRQWAASPTRGIPVLTPRDRMASGPPSQRRRISINHPRRLSDWQSHIPPDRTLRRRSSRLGISHAWRSACGPRLLLHDMVHRAERARRNCRARSRCARDSYDGSLRGSVREGQPCFRAPKPFPYRIRAVSFRCHFCRNRGPRPDWNSS